MKLTEFAVIVLGLIAGYWLVSKLFFPSRPTVAPPPSDQLTAPPEPAWHEVLQVAPDAPAESIRDAYRHLISKYHPDKVESLGQELKDLAAVKATEITNAYRAGMRARGLEA
jgi:hypothetical protein